ncbi:MAG: hypothetical protein AAB692_06030, partial [Patescibacteria group bacterium]
DCADTPDCKRAFGSCGPCPSREDFRYDSCGDINPATLLPIDNDSDQATQGANCQDPDCDLKLGSLTLGAHCAAAESGALCADGFDNNANAFKDCADAGCSGAAGPAGPFHLPDSPAGLTCQSESSAGVCGDGYDNDGDGKIDCADNQCYGSGPCLAKSWTNSACIIVPEYSGFFSFASGTPTVTARVTSKSHVTGGAPAEVEIRGTASYSAIAVYVGNNNDPAKYFPYAAAGCSLTGSGAAQMSFTSIDGHQIQIFNQTGQTITNFDVTLSCPTQATPQTVKNYQISVSMLKQPGDVVEYGGITVSTTLYEHTAPSIVRIEPEGSVPVIGGVLTVPYDNARTFRVVPDEPGAGLNASGICKCTMKVVGPDTIYASPDGECLTGPLTFQSDLAPITVSAKAQDGASNESIYSSNSTFTVNVVPAMTVALRSKPTGHVSPFLNDQRLSLDILDAEFRTGTTDTFGADCDVYVRNSSGVIVNGPVGPTGTFPGAALGNLIQCTGSLVLPPGLPDGEYGVTVRVGDSDSDALESNRQAIFVCNNVPGPTDAENVCARADFDDDGASEGFYTTPPLYAAVKYSCDNCLNLANDQSDANANGIGDACEPSDPFGRCQFDRSLVSQCATDAPPTCTGIRCPVPVTKSGVCHNAAASEC